MRTISVAVILLFTLLTNGLCQAPPPAKVRTTAIVQEEVAKNKSFLGLLYYDRVSNVASEVSGLVKTITVRDGNVVDSGIALVQLNTDLLDNDIELSNTRLEQAKLQIELATSDFERQKSLLKNRGASQKKYDDANFALRNARMEQMAASQTLARLMLQKEKSVISAPFKGIILEKYVDSGDWVQQGGKVVTIGASEALFVKVPVGETMLQFIKKDQEVDVTINAFGTSIKGVVDSLDPRADAKTKNVFVKVRIPPVENGAENMSATVHLPISNKQKLSIIPRDALIKFQGKDFVYTIKEDKATILPVNIVTFLDNRVAADNPYFVPGMPVITEGNERLRPDQPVTIIGE